MNALKSNVPKFTGKHLCQSLFFNKVQASEFCEIFKNTSGGCFCTLVLKEINTSRLMLALSYLVKYDDIFR